MMGGIGQFLKAVFQLTIEIAALTSAGIFGALALVWYNGRPLWFFRCFVGAVSLCLALDVQYDPYETSPLTFQLARGFLVWIGLLLATAKGKHDNGVK